MIFIFFIFNITFCFSQTDSTLIYTIVEEQAEFPGGVAAMGKFMKNNLVFPNINFEERGIYHTKIFAKFVVQKNGEIANIEIIKGMDGCPECNQAVVDAIKKMPKWKAAKNKGKSVNAYYNLPIQTHLK